MSVTLDQFIGAWTNQKVPSRGGITGQCVSLVQHWAEDQGVPGTPVFPVPAAKDMPGTRPDYFQWIPNTPTGVPNRGDIIVWGSSWGGGYGHTGIINSANVNSFQAFEQNNPTGSGAHLVNHANYSGVLGWLRLKQAAAPAAPQGVVMDTNAGKELYLTGLHRPAENDGAAAQWNGRKPADALQVLRGTPEWQMTDRKVKDYDVLAKQVQELSARPTKAELEAITSQLKASADKVAELEKQVKENPDTVLLDQSGGWLKQLWARLFGGK